MALMIGLSGVDGAGKTTLARAAVDALRARGERVTYHHELEMMIFRPLYLLAARILSPRRGEAIKTRFLTRARRGGWASDAYFLMLWSDSLVAYVWFRLRPGIVIHDRWIYDVLAYMDHIGYRRRAVRWLYQRFPRPQRLVLLTVSPATAMERKRSDPGHAADGVEFFEEVGATVVATTQERGCDLTLDTERSFEEVAAEFLDRIVEWRR